MFGHRGCGTQADDPNRLLMERCAGMVEKLPQELGQQRPFIVFDDADIEMAVKSLPQRRQGGDRLEIPQCRPDLCVRQPDRSAGRCLPPPTPPSPSSGGGLGRGLAAYFYGRDIGRIWRDIKERACSSLGAALVDRIS